MTNLTNCLPNDNNRMKKIYLKALCTVLLTLFVAPCAVTSVLAAGPLPSLKIDDTSTLEGSNTTTKADFCCHAFQRNRPNRHGKLENRERRGASAF